MFDRIFFKILVTSYCFVIINGAPTEFITLTHQEQIDMEIQYACTKWTFNDEIMKMPIVADGNTTGLYTCKDKKVIILVTAPMFFGFYPVQFWVSDNVTLRCEVDFWPGMFSPLSNKVTITGDEPVQKTEVNAAGSQKEDFWFLIVSAPSFVASHEGNYSAKCAWELTLDYGGQKYTHKESVDITAKPEFAVKNVRPSRTEITLIDTIYCLAEGNPEPMIYEWSCKPGRHGKQWSTSDNQLHILRAGVYICKCEASNEGSKGLLSAHWEGEIKAEKLPDMPTVGFEATTGSDIELKPEIKEEGDKDKNVDKPVVHSLAATPTNGIVAISCLVAMTMRG